MPFFKCTFLFSQVKAGWSETWYIFKTEQAQVLPELATFKAARNALLAENVEIEAARVSQVGTRGGDDPIPLAAVAPAPKDNADVYSFALLAFARGPDGYKRQIWLRGCPDYFATWDAASQSFGFNKFSAAAFATFEKMLKTRLWCFKANSREGADQATGISITAIDNNAGNLRLTVPTSGVRAGDTVKVKFVKCPKRADQRAINRRHTVLVATDTALTINLPSAALPDYAAFAGGKLFLYKDYYPQVTYGDIYRIARKKVGRAFFAPVGRRKKR